MSNEKILKYSLLAGSVYFLCISLAHVAGVKIPGLFIFYNIESYQYQDNIISFLAFGWAAFFYSGFKNLAIIKPVLLSALVAIAGLVNITVATDFTSINGVATGTLAFWLQIILLGIYVSWLWLFAVRSGCFARHAG